MHQSDQNTDRHSTTLPKLFPESTPALRLREHLCRKDANCVANAEIKYSYLALPIQI